MNNPMERFKRDFPDAKVIVLKPPPWGYCIMKCLRELDNKEYAHLPMFCSVEEHGRGNPVTLRKGNGDVICEMEWDEFKKVYVID